MSDIVESERGGKSRDRSSPEEPRGYVRHLPWKLGDLLPWYNCFYILDYLMIIAIIIGTVSLRAYKPTEANVDALDRLPEEVILEFHNFEDVDELWSGGVQYALWIGIPVTGFILAQIWVWSLHDLHNSLLGYIQSWAMTAFFVELFKRLFGALRPCYLERIEEYDDDDDAEYRDARMSFPSGHAATSMATLFFFSLYLLGKLRPFHEESGDGFLFQFVMIIAPTIVGLYVGVTRITEFQHFFTDVIGGWLIGIFFAFVSYCLVYYPPVWHRFDGRPKPKRSRNVQAVFMRRFKEKDLFPCIPGGEKSE